MLQRVAPAALALGALGAASAAMAWSADPRVALESMLVGLAAAVAAGAPRPWSRRAILVAPTAYLVAEGALGDVDAVTYFELLGVTVLVLTAAILASAVRDRADAQEAERAAAAALHERAELTVDLRTRLTAPRARSPLSAELERCRRHGSAFSLLRIRADRLGDPDVIARAAEIVGAHARASDVPYVEEDHELTIVLPGTTSSEARMAAERLRLAVAAEGGGASTVSIGVATYPLDGTHETEILDAAGSALERALALGGNRTVIATAAPGDPELWTGRGRDLPGG